MRQLPDKKLASRGRLPSDMDGDVPECRCEGCSRFKSRDQMVEHYNAVRGRHLLCRRCYEGDE